MDDRKLDRVGGLRMDKSFRALALKTSLKSFGKPFTLKGEALQAKEFAVDIGGNRLHHSCQNDTRNREIPPGVISRTPTRPSVRKPYGKEKGRRL